MKKTFNISLKTILHSFVCSSVLLTFTLDAASQYLKRSLSELTEVKGGLTTSSAHQEPVFGKGDSNSGIIRGISSYSRLIIDPGGKTNEVRYQDEEQVLFVLEGTGILNYNKESIPVTRNDFIYIPAGMNFQFNNPREQTLSVVMMGFKLYPDTCRMNNKGLMIANCDEVKFQTLPSHGPTTTFQLLLGTYESKRDRLVAACQVTSLFIMDFAAGGTNNSHSHTNEEEIYLILRGQGDIVAGKKDDGSEMRHPSVEGDLYFFSPGTLIGFYSGNKEGEEHARILAVRFKYPGK